MSDFVTLFYMHFKIEKKQRLCLDLGLKNQVPVKVVEQQGDAHTGVLLGGTVPVGCGANWIMAKPGHPFLLFAGHRLITENVW